MPVRNGPLERSQKQLYLAVKKELAPYERSKRRELALYERAFRKGLPKKIRTSTRHALLTAIDAAQVVLVGDFHPFRQSQKGFIRLVESSKKKRGRAVIALECFRQNRQEAIDQFLAGYITLEELREETDFDAHWPFPWENYREVLRLARRDRIPVIALNAPGTLRARDEAAAARLKRQLDFQPAATIFTLFGELHLGRDHLPRALKKVRIVVVHQNDADLYWNAPTLSDGQKPEVVRLGAGEFCILNSVPWVKLRSYLDWLEGNPTPDFEHDHVDATGLVHHYARLLSEASGIANPIDQAVEILPPDRLTRRAPALRDLGSPDLALASHALRFRRTGYLPRRGAIALPAVSTNSMLEAASHLLRHSSRKPLSARVRWGSDDFLAHFFLGYLGSKLLNPKRKCDEVPDLLRRAAKQDAVAARALAFLRPLLKSEKVAGKQPRLDAAQTVDATRSAGFVLGDRYFRALLRGKGNLKEVRKLFSTPAAKPILRVAARRIAQARVAAAGKADQF
jgi:hypothetical protein